MESERIKREWEEKQIKKLDIHPYEQEIESCEHLIYFCARQRKDLKKDGPEEVVFKSGDAQKKFEEQVKSGKLQEGNKVEERDAANKVKQVKKKREGPSAFYYEDDSVLNLDYIMVKKFSKLGLAPPTEYEQLPGMQETLQQLREALKMKGQMEQAQSKAKLLKDESWVKGEGFELLRQKLGGIDSEMLKKLDTVKREQLNWASSNDYDEGFNIDQEMSDEEIGQRFTRLKPEKSQKQQETRKQDGQKYSAQGKQTKFNAMSQDAFPNF